MKLAAATLAAVIMVGHAYAQAPAAPKSAAEKELEAKSGSMADRVVRGEALPQSDVLVRSPERAVTPSITQLEIVRAQNEREAVLRGDRGPIKQFVTAYKAKDWYAVGWASATLTFWLVGAGVVVWIVAHFVVGVRRHAGA